MPRFLKLHCGSHMSEVKGFRHFLVIPGNQLKPKYGKNKIFFYSSDDILIKTVIFCCHFSAKKKLF